MLKSNQEGTQSSDAVLTFPELSRQSKENRKLERGERSESRKLPIFLRAINGCRGSEPSERPFSPSPVSLPFPLSNRIHSSRVCSSSYFQSPAFISLGLISLISKMPKIIYLLLPSNSLGGISLSTLYQSTLGRYFRSRNHARRAVPYPLRPPSLNKLMQCNRSLDPLSFSLFWPPPEFSVVKELRKYHSRERRAAGREAPKTNLI